MANRPPRCRRIRVGSQAAPIVICADGGYVEPSRILALKGAQIIFSPHFNYIGAKGLIQHFQHVRADHVARAVENSVYFVRGNNVVLDKDPSITKYEGVGYGDSYIVDPGRTRTS